MPETNPIHPEMAYYVVFYNDGDIFLEMTQYVPDPPENAIQHGPFYSRAEALADWDAGP